LKNEVDRLRKRCAALEKSLQSIASGDAADLLTRLDRGDSATCSTPPTLRSKADGLALCGEDDTMEHPGQKSVLAFLDEFFMSYFVSVTIETRAEDSAVISSSLYQTSEPRPFTHPDGKKTGHALFVRRIY
jgi:hypothetical protein